MALVKCKEPIYDRQVEHILKRLEEGISKEEIAKELEYSNPISLDNYMRRKNFSWDSRAKNFVPATERYSARGRDNLLPLRGVSRIDQIISLFEQGDAEAKDIAIQVGFSSHKEMAKYMTDKGYEWDSHGQTYKKAKSTSEGKANIGLEGIRNFVESNESKDAVDAPKGIESILPFLQSIAQMNQETSNQPLNKTLPRYIVKGTLGTKTVHMSGALAHLVVTYSKEHNLSQREIFEIALIEFFQRYGYADEMDFCVGTN